MVKRRLILAVLFCIACSPPASQNRPSTAEGPRVRATVVTVRTTVQPAKQTYTQTIVIAGDLARNTSERDVWHLYDTKERTITRVDDIEKTIRTEPLQTVMARRREALARALPPHYPTISLRRTGEKRTIQNVSSEQSVIESGTYRRELWIGEHPSIPDSLFALMHASEAPLSPLAPMMRNVDRGLLETRGFPLLDRAEVTYGKENVVIERSVIAVQEREVPEKLLQLPKDYRDLTPKPAGARK